MEVKNEITKATIGGIQGETSIPDVGKNITPSFGKGYWPIEPISKR
jgi:hypothetical protein